jgi:hypothetical protein
MKYIVLLFAIVLTYIALSACDNHIGTPNLTVDTEHIKMERKGGKVELSSPFPMSARISGSNQLVDIGKLAVVEYQPSTEETSAFLLKKQDSTVLKDAIGNTYFKLNTDSVLIISVKK